MPINAVASFTFSTPALTCDSHSGSSGCPSNLKRETKVSYPPTMTMKVGDHDDVNQPKNGEHDLLFVDVCRPRQQVDEFDQEVIDINALGHDQSDVERSLEPAAEEDQAAEGVLIACARRFTHGRVGFLTLFRTGLQLAVEGAKMLPITGKLAFSSSWSWIS